LDILKPGERHQKICERLTRLTTFYVVKVAGAASTRRKDSFQVSNQWRKRNYELFRAVGTINGKSGSVQEC
jgi:hypothetical protein